MRIAWLWIVLAACGSEPEQTVTPIAPAADEPAPTVAARKRPRAPAPSATDAGADDPWNQPSKPPSDDPTDAMASDLAAWLPAKTAAAWQGTWLAYLPPGGNVMPTDDEPGQPVALRVEKNRAVVSDGTVEHEVQFSIDLPCAAMLTPMGSTNAEIAGDVVKDRSAYPIFKLLDRLAIRFAVIGGRMMVGEGAVGFRRGKAAVVCGVLHGERFVLDETGTCTKSLGTKPQQVSCVWRTPTVLAITCEGCWRESLELVADGNLLVSPEFRRNARPLVKAKDLAAAKRWAAEQRSR